MLAKDFMKIKDFTKIMIIKNQAKGTSQVLNFKLKSVKPANISKRPKIITNIVLEK